MKCSSFYIAMVLCLSSMSGSYAADVPSLQAKPAVDYVRVCSTHGAGFFYIPGTDSCLRVSGLARAGLRYVEPVSRAQDTIGFSTLARINLDARTSTSFGTLRAYVRFEMERSTGAFNDLFSQEDDDTLGQPIRGGIENDAEVDVAYIEFGGFTAGLIQSFFDFYTNDLNYEDLNVSDQKVSLLAYTATLGKGFSATLSLEDPTERRFGGAPFGGFPFPIIPGPGEAPGTGALEYAGERVPDFVTNVRLEQDWGEAQLSGAVHQVRPANFAPGGAFADTKYGFAVQAGAKFELPSLAEGDELWVQAAYAQGAVGYLGLGDYTQFGGVLVNGVDGFVDSAGDVRFSQGISVMSAFLHYWTPQVRQGVFGSYARLEFPGSGQATRDDPVFGPVNVGFVDFEEWRVGTNLIWSPVEDLDIGVEFFYVRLDPKGRVISAPIFGGPEQFAQRSISADDAWVGRLRINREF
jgi:hypothetical protein